MPEDSEFIYRRAEDGEIRRGIFHYPKRRVHCRDCGGDVTDEFYMIHHDLWDQCLKGAGGWICVPCIEDRLGRPLTRDDFILCPINVTTFRKTARLLERMGGHPLPHENLLRPHSSALPESPDGLQHDPSTTR